jgi:hypothetical protein
MERTSKTNPPIYREQKRKRRVFNGRNYVRNSKTKTTTANIEEPR